MRSKLQKRLMKKIGPKGQVNGNVYDYSSQMPIGNNDKGFLNIIRSPTSSNDQYIFEIKIENQISIYIEYLDGNPPSAIQDLVNHTLEHHTQVRITDGESGTMVAAGNRYDEMNATVLDYVPALKNNSKQRSQLSNLGKDRSLAMHGVIEMSGANLLYIEEMEILKEKENFTTHDRGISN